MSAPAGGRREQIVGIGLGAAVLFSAAAALLVRLPPDAGLGLSLALHGPHLLLALAAGAGFGAAGAVHAAHDDAGRGHPLLFALAVGMALGGARGADFAYLGPVASFLVGGLECALLFGALVLLAGRLGGAARLVTGVLLLLLLVAGLGAAIEAKGDPAGLRPWVWWLLGDVSRATYWTAAPVALLILGLTAGLVRSIDPGIHFADQTEATRRRLLGRAGLLFGLCLGAVGLVAFFALIVALAARWLLGHEALRSWTFAAAALGALAMIFADALPRALFGGLGPPVGIAIAAVAIPWYLLRNENRSYPWARGFEFLLGLLVGLGLLGAIYVLRQLATFIA